VFSVAATRGLAVVALIRNLKECEMPTGGDRAASQLVLADPAN